MLTFQDLLPPFLDELVKIARAKGSVEKRVKEHLDAEKKDWPKFESSMRSPRFVAELKKHPESDEKLKAYAEANNDYIRSKKVVLIVPGTGGKTYQIKKLPSGRLGCSCGDWQYKHSWNDTDCKHVKIAKAADLAKVAAPALSILGRGMGLANITNKAQKRTHQ